MRSRSSSVLTLASAGRKVSVRRPKGKYSADRSLCHWGSAPSTQVSAEKMGSRWRSAQPRALGSARWRSRRPPRGRSRCKGVCGNTGVVRLSDVRAVHGLLKWHARSQHAAGAGTSFRYAGSEVLTANAWNCAPGESPGANSTVPSDTSRRHPQWYTHASSRPSCASVPGRSSTER